MDLEEKLKSIEARVVLSRRRAEEARRKYLRGMANLMEKVRSRRLEEIKKLIKNAK